MRPGSQSVWLAVIVLSSLLPACGTPSDFPGPVDDGLAWHPPRQAAARRRSLYRLEYDVRLVPPEARHATLDAVRDYGHCPRMVVNQLRDGNLMFKGERFLLVTGSPEDQRVSLLALRDALQTLTANPEWRDPEGRSHVAVLFYTDKQVPWEQVPDLIRLVQEPGIRMHRVQWAVIHWASTMGMRRTSSWRHGANLTRLGDVPSGEAALPIGLRGRAADDHAEVTLTVGERTWSFGVGETDYRDPVFVTNANRIWAEAESAVEGTRELYDRASLTLGEPAPGVTWGHVVKAFDILLGEGFRVVDLPVQGWRLELEEPTLPPRAPRDDPILTPLTLGAVLLGLLLGAFVTLWPLRARRTPRHRGRGHTAI